MVTEGGLLYGDDKSNKMTKILTQNLLIGLYKKLACQNYVRSLLSKLNFDDLEFKTNEMDQIEVAIIVVKQIQKNMLDYQEIIPYTIRALLCYIMPGDPPNDISFDFPILFNSFFQPWILNQLFELLEKECSD